MPRVAIIIVTWNGLHLLQKCLASVVNTDFDNFEIVIADNASEDGSGEWIAATFPDVRVIRHPENWAFCKGNNEAIRQTDADYYVLLNNDVEVPKNWLRPLIDHMEANRDVAATQPKLLQFDDHSLFEYSGGSGGFLDKNGYPFTRGRIFFDMEKDEGQYDDVIDVFWATGACICMRGSALHLVGLLDESFELHMEEIDLCWRFQRHGFKVQVVPQSEVYHIGGASLPQGSPEKSYHNYRNSLVMLKKNYPKEGLVKVLQRRWKLDHIAMLRAMAKFNFKEFGAIRRAYRDAEIMSHELKTDPAARFDVYPNYSGDIVKDYFVSKKKKFSDLDI